MTQPYTLEQIRDFWTQQALAHGQAASASWSDQPVIDMEIREITKHLEDGDSVLDIGCANGYTTISLASQRKVRIKGLDYIPEMVEQARLRLVSTADRLRGVATFGVGDITKLAEPDNSYDKVVVVRVVINLAQWDLQVRAVRECLRVLRPGGRLLMSEATIQGWTKMNGFRAEWGLPPIPMPPFNRYLDEDMVIRAVEDEAELVQIENFSSTYFVGTRVMKPLLAKALGGTVDVANPDMEWNRWWAQLPARGDYGTQKLFILQKRA